MFHSPCDTIILIVFYLSYCHGWLNLLANVKSGCLFLLATYCTSSAELWRKNNKYFKQSKIIKFSIFDFNFINIGRDTNIIQNYEERIINILSNQKLSNLSFLTSIFINIGRDTNIIQNNEERIINILSNKRWSNLAFLASIFINIGRATKPMFLFSNSIRLITVS